MFRVLFHGHVRLNRLWLAATAAGILLCCPLPGAGDPRLQRPGFYTGTQDVTGWVMSEKLDGIRGYWDGTRLLTRKGRPLSPPAWFIRNFPPFELDGELWSSRGEFEFIQSVVLDTVPGQGWKRITYNIFEVPNQKGEFLSRLKIAAQWFAAHPNPAVRIIPQIPVREHSDLDQLFRKIESDGGEGLVVKDPKPAYHTERSPHVLKVKKARDMEGKVVGINPGKGKYEGMMGSLTIELESGIRFRLGTGFPDQVRRHPPREGDVITFRYHGFSRNNIPKFASFLRIRSD